MKKENLGKSLCRLIMAVAIMTFSLQAMADGFSYTYQGKTLDYIITSDSTVELGTFQNKTLSGKVSIPASIEHNGTTYSVTSIACETFVDCSITSVTIPNSVISIELGAFSCNYNLTAINVASGNKHYSSIGGVLYNYAKDTLILCPQGKTQVTIPNSVTTIGIMAFDHCRRLTSIKIPNSVISIEDAAFYRCHNLTSVIIGSRVKYIGDVAFRGCGLSSITIPNSVTTIGSSAFGECGLVSVTIGSGVTYIGAGAFCQLLGSCVLEFQPEEAFRLKSINVVSGNKHYSSINGVLYSYAKDTLIQCPSAKTSFVIPNSVTTIGADAFEGCCRLTSVTIPNSVTTIGSSAFAFCVGLTSIKIPDNVTTIEDRAFWACNRLTTIKIPKNVTYIGDEAFACCSRLTSITIPNYTYVVNNAFDNCDSLTSITRY